MYTLYQPGCGTQFGRDRTPGTECRFSLLDADRDLYPDHYRPPARPPAGYRGDVQDFPGVDGRAHRTVWAAYARGRFLIHDARQCIGGME